MSASLFEKIKEAIIRANTVLPEPVLGAISAAAEEEKDPRAKTRLHILLENARIAAGEKRPICQDTGLLNAFLFLPEGCELKRGLKEALNRAVFEAYREGGFRFSTVNPPLLKRRNPGTNQPVFLKVVPVQESREIRLVLMPKGAGSENASFLMMLKPTTSYEEVVRTVAAEIIKKAPLSCPPVAAGVAVGGTFDSAPLNAKLSLLEVGIYETEFSREVKELVNESGIGPFGLGGSTTAFWITASFEPTHMASLPVAISMSCHALRYAELKFTLEEWESSGFGVI